MKINNNKDLIDKIIVSSQSMWYILSLNGNETSYNFIWIKATNVKCGSMGYYTPCCLTIDNIESGDFKIIG